MVAPRVQPASPGIPSGGTIAPDQASVNRQLMQLYQSWYNRDPGVAQSILRYITSGWTTPIDPRAQQAVSLLVGRQVPTTGAPGGGVFNIPATGANNGQPLYPPGGGGQGENTPLPANAPLPPGAASGPVPLSVLFANSPGAPAYATPGAGVWPGQPPGAGQNNPASLPDPRSLPLGLFGGLTQGPGGANVFGPNPPASYNPPPTGPTGASSQGSETAPPGVSLLGGLSRGLQNASARVQQAASGNQGGTPVVAPFAPSSGNPLTTPATFPGTVNPSSAIGQQGYTQAQAGDQTALNAVLTKILGTFGIDVARPGIFTPGLVQSIAPYLKTVMEYYGLQNGGSPVLPSDAAAKFSSMIGGPNTFGQIQDFARGLLPQAQTLLGNASGALAGTANQQGMINDLLGMLTAGTNPIQQQYQQGILGKSLSDYTTSQLGGPTQNYADFLRQNVAKMPGADLLAQIIGSSGVAGR